MIGNKFLFLTIILGLLSCQKPKPKAIIKPKVTHDNLLIEWGICSVWTFQNDGRGMLESFNVCPVISFLNDHTGFIKTGNAAFNSFSWKADSDTLVIKEKGNIDANDIFNLGGVLKISLTENKTNHEIYLFNSVRRIKYVLNR